MGGKVVGTAPEQSLWDPTDCHTPNPPDTLSSPIHC